MTVYQSRIVSFLSQALGFEIDSCTHYIAWASIKMVDIFIPYHPFYGKRSVGELNPRSVSEGQFSRLLSAPTTIHCITRRARFELAERNPFNRLAICRFQPLSHLRIYVSLSPGPPNLGYSQNRTARLLGVSIIWESNPHYQFGRLES